MTVTALPRPVRRPTPRRAVRRSGRPPLTVSALVFALAMGAGVLFGYLLNL